jgi:opacity protein-like surface antigen
MKRLKIISVIALAILACGAASASAGTQIQFSGQPWRAFSGTGRLGQHWSPAHVILSPTGNLNEWMYGGTGGGVGSLLWRTYGTYSVTYRISKGGGKYVFGLFGKAAHDEIDFTESDPTNSARSAIHSTLHYGASNTMIRVKTAGDFTQWHTTTVIWKAGSLNFLVDGISYGKITSHVPSTPMHMFMQENAAGASARTVLQISKVTIS